MHYGVGPYVSILPFSVFLFGIGAAPIVTPHLSERFGRRPIYLVGVFISSLFTIGASQAKSFAALSVCRYFAGLFGGPSLVLIEGTFADMWSANLTGTYYSFLTLASYYGAGFGPIILGYIVPQKSFRWTDYVSLMFTALAFVFSAYFPETYPREILRRRAHRAGVAHNLPPAQSGTTLPAMAKHTILNPVLQLFTEPPVLMITFALLLNFANLFSWFVVVPPVLTMTYNFSLGQDGLAFFSAIAGTSIAIVFTIFIDFIAHPTFQRRAGGQNGMMGKFINMNADIEYRLLPAMLGVLLIPASLFWIGFTAKPNFHFLVPIFGTMVYVWGSAMVLISYITWLFDAYSPPGTLSALTVAATVRILGAGVLPLVILQDITSSLGGDWGLSIFGFINIALIPIPFILFLFGKTWRQKSRYAAGMDMVAEKMGTPQHDETRMPTRSGEQGMYDA